MPEQISPLPGVLITVDVDTVTPMINDIPGCEVHDHIDEVEQRLFGVREGVQRVLDVLAEYGIRSTFFIPGLVADRAPHLVRAVVDADHEIGLHGWQHESARKRSFGELREEIRRSLTTLGEAGAPSVRGHRAPEWHVTTTLLDALAAEGISYDSSMFGAEKPHVLALGKARLHELPVSWALDDAPYLLCTSRSVRPVMGARELGTQWCLAIDQFIRHGQLAVLAVHPWIIGRCTSLVALEMVCEHVRARRVWTGAAVDLVDQVNTVQEFPVIDPLEGIGWWPQ